MENNNQEKSGFTYTYSARDQAELKRIRDKYTAPTEDEDKMARLIRLDKSVTSTARTFAIIWGAIATLILGSGMSLCMTDLATIIGIHTNQSMTIGITVGIVGGLLASLAYPIYNVIVGIKKRKIAPEIIRLTNDLIK